MKVGNSLTEFGKAIRKARIDADITLVGMAHDLQISPSFLSAVETGNKKFPIGLADRIKAYFCCHGIEIELHKYRVIKQVISYI